MTTIILLSTNEHCMLSINIKLAKKNFFIEYNHFIFAKMKERNAKIYNKMQKILKRRNITNDTKM